MHDEQWTITIKIYNELGTIYNEQWTMNVIQRKINKRQ